MTEIDDELKARIEGLKALREFVEARTKIADVKWKTTAEILADVHPMQDGVGATPGSWAEKMAKRARGV